MLLAGCRLLLPLLSKAARDGRARSSDCLDPATGGEAAGAGSSVWGEQAVAQEPGLAPPWGAAFEVGGEPSHRRDRAEEGDPGGLCSPHRHPVQRE